MTVTVRHPDGIPPGSAEKRPAQMTGGEGFFSPTWEIVFPPDPVEIFHQGATLKKNDL